jgi:hypothetical protein
MTNQPGQQRLETTTTGSNSFKQVCHLSLQQLVSGNVSKKGSMNWTASGVGSQDEAE